MQGQALKAAVFPGQVDPDISARPQAFYGTLGPGSREGRQQAEHPFVGLQQHFGYPGRIPEIPVDLEGRVDVHQVFVNGLLQKDFYMLMRRLGLQQAGVEVDDPGAAPARAGAPVVEAVLNRLAGRLKEGSV